MINVTTKFCPAIIVMVKTPRAGEVKTRLQPLLTNEQAASLAMCFFKDTVLKIKQLVPDIIIGFTPADGRDELSSLICPDLLWVPQAGNNLGEKMESVIKFTENKGFSPIIVVGTDSPTLPFVVMQTALDFFRSAETELVLGPTIDGGYYLIGLRKNINGIFDNINWSSPEVFQQTIENAQNCGITGLKELPVWYDIDTPEDLLSLLHEVLNNVECQQIAPTTYQWLLNYDLRIG